VDRLLAGSLSDGARSELVTCGHPRYKLSDACHWSVPTEPLHRTVSALHGASFDRVVYGGEGCAAYLNSTDEEAGKRRIPVVSENVLYCAMHAAGVRPSTLVDSRLGATRRRRL
jgi:hypothetical protein